jgi:hypothetical protein
MGSLDPAPLFCVTYSEEDLLKSLLKPRRWMDLASVCLLGISLLVCGTVARAEERDPILSARVLANGGGEVEVHVGPKFGIGVSYVPGFHTVDVTSNGSTVCKAKFDRTFFFGRYSFKGPKDSWYVGGAAYQEKLASSSDCGESAMSGAIPMVGYQWVWDSGFNLDLGLRPGILAAGFTF